MEQSKIIVQEHLSRLGNVRTRWSLLRSAGKSESSIVELRNVLVLRYAAPIRSYVQGIVNNEDEADELAQDAVVRLLTGDFAGADPNRGRFRDFLKTALRNMVRNHWKRTKVRKTDSLIDDISDGESELNDPWVGHWRKNLLDMAWADLKQIEETSANRIPYSVLNIRAENSDASSKELAALLSQRLGREVKPDAFRQQLKRARQRFVETLLNELRDGLDDPTESRVHDEVVALGLYPWLKESLSDE